MIDKLEEDDIPGLLLLIDFEKAFDTVEWSFIEKKTLQFYGFGPSLQKWIKAFYCDISSAVTNNGHVSEFFSLGSICVRQGDHLSPYLFIYSCFITLECCNSKRPRNNRCKNK